MGGDPLRLSLVALLSCHGPAAPVLPSGEGRVLTVLTYNVNFERFDPATIEAIASADADLVLLQETTAQWEAALRTRG